VLNLINSRTGRAIMAVRDNRIAAESVGINTTKYRLIAFVVSAALAGMAGVLYGLNFSSIVPKKFDFNTSILILVFVVLGGMGNIRGGIIAAIVLTILPEKLRFIGDFRMLMYAIVLISVMLVTNNKTFQTKLGMLRERIRRRKDPDLDLVASRAGGDGNE
jgi:branched-chain amino acid transport system permease protein